VKIDTNFNDFRKENKMKRPSKHKLNVGPKNLRNRKEKTAKAQEFIAQCEQSLIRLIEQKALQGAVTWLDLEKELRERFYLLRETYPDHKGKVAVAVHNVELALSKVKMEAK
jgi:hypothetical protein